MAISSNARARCTRTGCTCSDTALSARRTRHFRHAWKAMGSPCELQLFAARNAEAQQAINAVVADVERLEQLYSRYRDSSLLSSINRVAMAGGSITVDAETAGLLNYASTLLSRKRGAVRHHIGGVAQGVEFRQWSPARSVRASKNCFRVWAGTRCAGNAAGARVSGAGHRARLRRRGQGIRRRSRGFDLS